MKYDRKWVKNNEVINEKITDNSNNTAGVEGGGSIIVNNSPLEKFAVREIRRLKVRRR